MLLVPLGLVASAMLFTGRASVARAVPAFLIGVAGLFAVNAARLLLISGMTHSEHLEGFGWAHTIYGSVVALVGLAAVLVGFVWFVTGSRRRKNEV
jgi:exosortase/archaeosortase family protein